MNHPAGRSETSSHRKYGTLGRRFPYVFHGRHASVYRVMKAMDHEKLPYARSLDILNFHFRISYLHQLGLRFSSGPNSMKHRYVTEDIRGAVMYSSLGKMGVPPR
jgi:hypothetical protein